MNELCCFFAIIYYYYPVCCINKRVKFSCATLSLSFLPCSSLWNRSSYISNYACLASSISVAAFSSVVINGNFFNITFRFLSHPVVSCGIHFPGCQRTFFPLNSFIARLTQSIDRLVECSFPEYILCSFPFSVYINLVSL